MKRSKKRVVMVVIIVVLLFIILTIIFILKSGKLGEGGAEKYIEKAIDIIASWKKSQETGSDGLVPSSSEPFSVLEDKIDSVGGGGGGGDRGGEGVVGGEKVPSGYNCRDEQIAYYIIKFNETSICNQYNGNVCEDKTVICSVEIHNNDKETGGVFEIQFVFFEWGKTKDDAFDSVSSSFFIEPKEYEVFEGATSIQSQGQDGLANKQINCFYSTLQVPKKQVCY